MGLFDKITKSAEAFLDRQIAETQGSAFNAEDLVKKQKEDGIGRKGLLFDPFMDQGYSGGLFKPKGGGDGGRGFLSNHILKVVSRRDPVVATILNVRADQVAAFCRKQANRFDTGFRLMPKDKTMEPDPDEVREAEEFLLNCGYINDRSAEDKLTFDQWGYMITQDMLRYGHCANELIPRNDGKLYAFLPLPAESIYYANKKMLDKQQISQAINAQRNAYRSNLDEGSYDIERAAGGEYEFVQVIDGKVLEGFSRDELVMWKVSAQGDTDLNGYALGPLERAISMITAHLKIENHQQMFFTHGVASKGLLVIQGSVTPNQLRTLQSQWTSQVTGPSGAWRTPILAGIEGVQWTPLTMGNKDMEYAAYQDHVLRTIHACFNIDPEETGYGYLSRGTEQKSLGESSNEWKVTASRDRGLRPILTRIESLVNEEILPRFDKDIAEKYHFVFSGLDAETRQEENERLGQEVSLHTTLDEARKQAELEPIDVGGGLIMNPLLVQTLQGNLYKGVFMEKFMNIPGASERPDLQYIPDPFWFQWQQFQLQMMQMQAAGQQEQEGGGDDGGGEGGPPKKKKEGGDGDGGGEQADQAQLEAQRQAEIQAQMAAVDQFISANPDLFKSMKANLKKTELNDSHVDKMRDGLVKDFEKAADQLVKDVMKAVAEDMRTKDGAEEGDPKDGR